MNQNISKEKIFINVIGAMQNDPRFLKNMQRAFEIPMLAGTVVGTGIGMSSENHKVRDTGLGLALGGSLGSVGGIATSAAICHYKYKIF